MVVSLVPVPASVRERNTPPFLLDEDVQLVGDPTAGALLSVLIVARTGTQLRGPSALGRPIELRIMRGGPRESYRITVDTDSVIIDGADAAGLFYGVQTLGQLITRTPDGWAIPTVDIDDAPRFAYRGVMLDVARHFFPVAVVTAYIDRAASLKLNHLHLHLTDDQGWRLALRSRPELATTASGTAVDGDAGGFYTREDYRAIVAHAASRHMTVVPEVDVPGHTHAVGLAYPELVEAPVITDDIRTTASAHGGGIPVADTPYTGLAVGFSSLKIRDERTYSFLADVLGEIAGMTPGPYLHIGGDECLGTDPADFATFVRRVTELVCDLDKTPIAWHEAGAAAGLASGTVGQYWGAVTPAESMAASARAFVRNGAGLIMSPSDAVYLDMKPEHDFPLGLVWADGPTTLARAYGWEPLAVIEGLTEADILGVEAPLWTETIRTLRDIDAMAFPRAAAAAEIAWSPPATASAFRTWDSFRDRVGGLAPLWSALGIAFTPLSEITWSVE